MQKQKTDTPGTTLKPKQDFAFLSSLPTLFTLEGNPSTILEVIGLDDIHGPKYVKKTIIINKDNQKYAYSERTMMQIINSDYVLKLLHWELVLYMNFCEKGDLNTFLSEANPSIAQRIEIFIDILYAMRFLHEKFIIHRDMKLENIFVTEDQKIQIADLGYSSQTVSVAHTDVGTFAYKAPEVAFKKEDGYGEKVDVWSVGYLGFQILNKPLAEEVKKGKLIRDPFMPASVLREKVKCFKGSLQVEYLKIFEQNPLVFVPQIPNSLKFLLGDMLVPNPQKRISFRQIYEGKYLQNLRRQLQESKDFGPELVEGLRNLHALIHDYPKIYQTLKVKQKRLTKHEELYDYLYYRLYHPLTEKLFDGDVKSMPAEKANGMRILLFLAMRKMKTIYQEVKGEDFFVLKKKLQDSDKAISTKYLQVKNSVEAYLRGQGQKGIEQNKELMDEDYFIKLMKIHAKDIKINASSIIE